MSEGKNLFLVGIASSAGGIEPLMDLIEEAVCHKNMAFIVVPHLSSDHETRLPSILKRVSTLTIKTIEAGMSIEPCYLYVLPPGSYARIVDGCFVLDPRPKKEANQSANIMFESLGEFYKQNSIGVVLSGSGVGADGSKGVCTIKKNRGHTYAQEPTTARFPHMPELAIKTGCVDSILPPKVIGHELTLISWAESP